MKIFLKVKTNAKQEKVVQADGNYLVWLKSPATEGKANQALIKVLAAYFHLPPSRVIILKGLKSHLKTVLLEPA